MTELESIDDTPKRDRGTFDWGKFGRIIKHYRTIKTLRLEDLQDMSGVAITVISNLEKGRPADIENVLALSVLMNVDLRKLHSKYGQAVPLPVKIEPTKPAPSVLDLLTPDPPAEQTE